ncbi:MAG: hypothetical protein RL026_1039 [Pseudomonadota bacterium]|jgi:carotenoid cleavage dioxygenase
MPGARRPRDKGAEMDTPQDPRRRALLAAAVAAPAMLGAYAARAAEQGWFDGIEPEMPLRPAGSGGQFSPLRAEVSIADCEVEGRLPADLDGGFYAVGPDPQYRLHPRTIVFDGEGHVRMFRIRNGRVDYRTRYIRNPRYLAQDAARRNLMPLYRNPYTDDPSVRGLNRGTHNTHVLNHQGLILALKEDTAPAALDLNTLEMVDPQYTFGGQLPANQPFTAHPKICSRSGNIVAFGYEAEGHGSDVVSVYELEHGTGRKLWEARFKVPYISMIHDFAVTENHVLFFVVPLVMDPDQMARGGVHWSWDKNRRTHLGVMRRHGDGKDLRWIDGPLCSGLHTMGAFEEGDRLYFDTEMTAGNPFPFMPNKDGSPPDLAGSTSHLHRLTVDLKGRPKAFGIERLFPLQAPLPRQDDRYNTMPYRWGFANCPDPSTPPGRPAGTGVARVDLQTRRFEFWNAGQDVSVAEPVFAPRNLRAAEGEGYLLAVAYHLNERLRSDLLVFDAQRIPDGPVARVKLPLQASPQIHGWWVRGDQYPTAG